MSVARRQARGVRRRHEGARRRQSDRGAADRSQRPAEGPAENHQSADEGVIDDGRDAQRSAPFASRTNQGVEWSGKMAMRVRPRRGIRLPVTLSVLLITVNVVLMIC